MPCMEWMVNGGIALLNRAELFCSICINYWSFMVHSQVWPNSLKYDCTPCTMYIMDNCLAGVKVGVVSTTLIALIPLQIMGQCVIMQINQTLILYCLDWNVSITFYDDEALIWYVGQWCKLSGFHSNRWWKDTFFSKIYFTRPWRAFPCRRLICVFLV